MTTTTMRALPIACYLISLCSLQSYAAFTPPWITSRPSPIFRKLQTSNSDDANTNSNDLSWLHNAMGTPPIDPTPPPLQPGISGFAVDPHLGFVCVLSDNQGRFTYAVVSPDTDKLSSAEALCLVQLAGGLDLGAAVFPPETLARIVWSALEDEDENEEVAVQQLRPKVTLLGVTALKNENHAPEKKEDVSETPTDRPSSPERDAKIHEAAPRMLPAVKNLPGLAEVTPDQILSAMQIHADADGDLDRAAFSELLGTLRGRKTGGDDQKLKFRITASISDDLKLVDVDHVPAFQAVALALRYQVTVDVSQDCFEDEEVMDVWTRFPALKPVQELVEDAQVMDGFISSMFFKEKAPDNDDKM